MTYIGNPQGTGFSKIDSQQFSGTGSKTAYTMRHPVSQAEHVSVYVNNVRQDPHMAYTVSGTTLTFTEAPSNATNNIYVVYLGGAINTTELPTDVSLGVKGGIINAPSIFKHGEIQTGAYFPAANTVALVQGGKEILRANNSFLELKISGTTVATINSTGLNIAGSVFDDGTALLTSVSANTQLGSGVVTQHAIASGNVVTSTINNGAVTAVKIQDDLPVNKLSVNNNHIIVGNSANDGQLRTISGDATIDNTAALTIANGAINNAKVASDAAIAGSKISPTFTSNITVTNASPKIFLTDTNNNDDYEIRNDDGTFTIRNSTDGNDMISVASNNTTTFTGNCDFSAGIDVTGSINATTNITLASTTNGQALIITKNGTQGAKLGHIGSGNEGLLVLKDGGTDTVLLNGESGGSASYINSGNFARQSWQSILYLTHSSKQDECIVLPQQESL